MRGQQPAFVPDVASRIRATREAPFARFAEAQLAPELSGANFIATPFMQ